MVCAVEGRPQRQREVGIPGRSLGFGKRASTRVRSLGNSDLAIHIFVDHALVDVLPGFVNMILLALGDLHDSFHTRMDEAVERERACLVNLTTNRADGPLGDGVPLFRNPLPLYVLTPLAKAVVGLIIRLGWPLNQNGTPAASSWPLSGLALAGTMGGEGA